MNKEQPKKPKALDMIIGLIITVGICYGFYYMFSLISF